MTNRDWKPRLSSDGQFYCSPSCGGGKYCRKEWHDKAVADADALCTRMGDGWEPDVWENLGWHYKITKGKVSIHANRRGSGGDAYSYSAWIEPGVVLRGITFQVIADGQTPEDALGNAVQDARTAMSRLTETLDFLNDVVEAA